MPACLRLQCTVSIARAHSRRHGHKALVSDDKTNKTETAPLATSHLHHLHSPLPHSSCRWDGLLWGVLGAAEALAGLWIWASAPLCDARCLMHPGRDIRRDGAALGRLFIPCFFPNTRSICVYVSLACLFTASPLLTPMPTVASLCYPHRHPPHTQTHTHTPVFIRVDYELHCPLSLFSRKVP